MTKAEAEAFLDAIRYANKKATPTAGIRNFSISIQEDPFESPPAQFALEVNCVIPTVTLTGSLSAFSACAGTASATQTLSVSGSDLTANITVSAPTGYEVSLSSGSGFGSSVTVTQSGGSVSATTIYVRLKSDATNGSSGNVEASSTGATAQTSATGTATVSAVPTTTAAGPDQSKCGNGSFTLAGNTPSTGTGAWSLVSGTATISSSSSATSGVTGVPAGGSATLRWTISNGVCTASTDDVVLTNNSLPTVSISPSAPSIAYGGSQSLTASGASTYSWSPSTGLSATTGGTVTANPTTTTTYTVTGTDANGCQDTETVTVTVAAQPTVTLTGTLSAFSACAGTASATQTLSVSGANLTANITVSAPTGYEVSLSSGSGFGASVTVTQSGGSVSATTIYVRLKSDATNGASGNVSASSTGATAQTSATGTATVSAVPTTAAAGPDQSQCNSGTFTLAGNTPTTGTGAWSLVSGTATISSSSSATSGVTGVPAGGSATLRWTISNGVCTASTDDVVLTNNSLPTVSISPSAPSIAYGGSQSLTASGASTYSWSPSTGLSATTGGTVTANPTTTTTYTVTGTDANGCQDTETVTVTVAAQPTVTLTGTLSAFSACAGTASATQTLSVSGSNLTANITVSAPTGYEVSLSSGSGFGSSVTVNQSGGSVSATTIYVRLLASATNGASGNVSASSTGATAQTSATGTATVSAVPTTATAGPDQSKCGNGSFTLAGNVPSTGTGVWSLVSGTATISSSSSATSGVTGVPEGTSATLRWTISNGVCAASTDDVVLTNDGHATVAEAGVAQEQCNNGSFTLAGNSPTTGTGLWSVVTGTATITTPSSPSSTITGVPVGTSATLRWTVTNGTCSSTDDVVLQNDALPTTAAAGPDQANCNNGSFTMAGNAPSTGSGTWTVVSGTATIASASSANSGVSGIPAGTSATLRWTTTNGTCTSTDDMVLTNNSLPTVAVTPTAPSIAYAGNVTLTASGASTYSWSPSTGLSATTGAVVTATLTTTTTYTVTGTDANGCQNTANVTVTVGSAPSITLSGTLSPFSTCAGTASATQTLTLNGANLEADVNLTAPTGYEISLTSGSGFASSLTVTRTGTTVTGVSIYVRLKSDATNGASGNISASTTNATTQTAATGTGTVYAAPTAAAAGPDQTQCDNGAFTLAGNTPTTGTGTWTVVSGTATITTPSSATSGVTGVPAGTSATLRWTITNGSCPASTDDVVLTNDAHATAAEAGIGQEQCNNGSFTLSGNTPTTGTGTWSIVRGTATITNPSSANSGVTGVPVGTIATLRWTVTNGTCTSTDTVNLQNDALPTTAAAGADQATCNNGGFTLAANAPSTGTGQWTVVSGTATITTPSSPTSTVTGIPVGTSATLRWTTTNGTCSSTDDVVLTNNSLPTVTVTPSAPSIVYSTSVSMTASGASTYTWSPSTGLSATTGATVTATLTSTTTYTVTGTDANGCQNTQNVTVTVGSAPTISGSVFDDADGLTDGNVDGTGSNAGGLYVNLVSAAGNVLSSKAANADGTYTFDVTDGIAVNTNFTIILTTAAQTLGNALSTAILNTGWVSMGEDCCDNTGSDGTADSKLFVSVTTTSLNNANFGVNRTPTATPNSGSFTNPGGTNTIQVPSLAGTDPEDGALTSTMIISTLPTNGTLYYNGTPVTAGQTITSYDPTKLRFDPNDGITSASFTFKVVDAAGVQSTAATITMNFGSLFINGTVYDDADGLTDGNVDGTGTNAGGLYVNLVNAAGNVVASKAVNVDGSYSFSEADGVQINTNYTIVLTTTVKTVGNALSTASLVSGWVSMGEDCCDNTGSDGTADSKLSVSVTTTSLNNVNFGVNRTPTATPNSGSFTNPGGTNTIQVPTLAGTDPEDGALTSTMIISTLPTNGTLYYNGTPMTAGQSITSYDPTKLRFDPNDGITSASFTFKVVDAAGVQSTAATITMNFGSLFINGTVYDDADGLTDGNVDGTGTNAGGLYVNLVNAAGNVVASKAVNADGSYSFSEADGVQINTTFSIILTTGAQTVGNALSTASLNTGWVSMGEDCCDNTGSDGTADSKLSVSVTTTSLNNANFGVNRTPTATPNSGSFTNPGGTNTIQVPTLAGTDPEDGALTSTMIISTLPTNGTLYYNGTPVTAGQTITSYDPTKLRFDPNDGITSASFTFKVVDAAGVQSTAAAITMNFGSLSINGTVYDDADGLTDGNVDGTGTNGGGLYVNLVNSAGNVVASKAVNADGTYSFTEADGVQINTTFSIILTTSAQTVGNALSTASLNTGWVSMGEDCCDNTGSDGTADSKLSVSVTTTSLNNANFGVNRTPTATPNSGSFTNPGGTNTIQVPTLAGTDPEDGALTSTMIISTLPTNGTLYYNGTPVTAGQTITSYDPTKLRFDPNDGITSASFTFKVVDAAGVQSTAATITMNFSSLSIAGTVYDDADGLTDGQVDGTGTNAGGLYVNLVNSAGNVVASKAVNADGTYSFTEADGVQINTTFSIILTTGAQTVGNALSTASLNTGWVSMGEDCCDNTGSDGTADSKLSVSVTTTSLNNANFGVNRTPTATLNSGSFTNPGGTNTIQVPTLAGTDPEDGALTSTMIISTLPTNGTLYYNGTPVTAGQTITSYDPTKLRFDPNDGITSASFTFKVIDAAGVQSTAATITMNFGSLFINGTVYDDADGLADGNVDGTGSNAGGLYVNLVNSAGNLVASKAVNADGSYSFTEADGVQINTTFSIILTTGAQTVGNALSTATLNTGWVSMGEDCCDGTGSDGTPDSKLSVSIAGSSVGNANFGVNRTPTATPNSGTFLIPVGNQTIQVPTLAGTDPEDGPLTSTMIISTLPTNGTLYYNGTPVTAGQTITGYDPTKLQFDPNDGITLASFTFKVVDAAGVQSPAATITMNFDPPQLNVTGSLTPFITCAGTVTAPQTLTVSGMHLVTDITATAPAGYEISLNPTSGYAGTITIAKTGSTVANTLVYVRLTAAAVHGASGNISFSVPGLSAVSATTGSAIVYGIPTVANAGADQVNCNNGTFTMAGNAPTVGTGIWTVVSGTATITTPSSATTTVTGVPAGTSATLRWTVGNGTCPSTSDDVVVTNTALPTVSAAGADLVNCNNGTFTMSGNVPTVGTGVWTVISGTATITTPSSATTTVTGVPAGTTAILRWSISNGICPVSPDDIMVTNTALPTTAAAGLDLINCNNGTFTMAGNVPTVGTGAWTVVSGTATITNPTSATTTITGVPPGTSATLRWTISNGICPVSTDEMTVTNQPLPTTAQAGTDQALCNTSIFTMAANTPSIGTGKWILVSGTAMIVDDRSPTTSVSGIGAGSSVTLRWSITNGICAASTDDVVLTNKALATVASTTPAENCGPASLTLTATSSAGGTIRWFDAATGGNLLTTGNTLTTAVLSTTTTYYAEAILDGCPSLVRVPVTATIKPVPPTPTVTAQGPTTFCEGLRVTLNSSSATGNQWYRNGVLIPGAVSQSYIASQSGSYHVVVTNTQGCSSQPAAAMTVVVNPIPAMPASISGLTSVSEGSSQTYTATPVPGATAYIWTLPSGWTGSSTTNTITTVPGMTGGRITVRATANGCTSPAAFLDVTVVDDGEILKVFKSASAPELQPDGTYLIRFAITLKNLRNQPLTSVMVTDDLTRTFPNPITFQVTQVRASGGLSVDPLYNGRSLVELLTTASTLSAFGTDSINLTVKIEPNGYSGSVQNIADVNAATPLGKINVQSIDMSRSGGRETGPGVPTLTIIKPVQLIIPTIFTPNNDGFNDRWVIVRPAGVRIKVQVYNRWGQMVYRSDDYRNNWDGKGTGSFLGQDLPHGSYFFLVDIDDTRTGTKEVRRGALMLKRDTY